MARGSFGAVRLAAARPRQGILWVFDTLYESNLRINTLHTLQLLVDIATAGKGCFSFIPDSGFVGTVLVRNVCVCVMNVYVCVCMYVHVVNVRTCVRVCLRCWARFCLGFALHCARMATTWTCCSAVGALGEAPLLR